MCILYFLTLNYQLQKLIIVKIQILLHLKTTKTLIINHSAPGSTKGQQKTDGQEPGSQ